MLSETQGDLYFERMASSLGDKIKMVPFIKPGQVLDVGAGGGEFAEQIRLLGNDVSGLDGSPEAVHWMSAHYPDLNVVAGMVADVNTLFAPSSLDTITCSAILHEVFSYGSGDHFPYDLDSIREALALFADLLTTGGRLIIRDGVMPDAADRPVVIRFTGDDGADFVSAYAAASPRWGGDAVTGRSLADQRRVSLVKTGERDFIGTLDSAMEVAYTYTWGLDALPRESQEIYGVFTESDYVTQVEATGLSIVHREQYVQPGYVEHLSPLMSIVDAITGDPLPFPSTNMLLVAEKQ